MHVALYVCLIWKGRTNQRIGGNNKMNGIRFWYMNGSVHTQKKATFRHKFISFSPVLWLFILFHHKYPVPVNRIKDKMLWFQLFDMHAFYLCEKWWPVFIVRDYWKNRYIHFINHLWCRCMFSFCDEC